MIYKAYALIYLQRCDIINLSINKIFTNRGFEMKKIIALILLTTICFSMCACDPISFVINRESLDDVIGVELIEYVNPDQKHFITWVPDQSDDLAPFNLDNTKVLETLPEEKISDFLDAFSATDILHTYYAYNSPKDICIRLNYENGDFLIIWANYAENSYAGYIGEDCADGTVSCFWGCFSSISYYRDLVSQYFNYTLE